MRVPISEIFGRRTPATTTVRPFAGPSGVSAAPPVTREPALIEIGAEEPEGAQRRASEGYFSRLHFIGQFKRMYLVCEDASGLVIIDQHAAHERIAFERLKKVYREEHLESQPLLFPERISLDTLRAALMADSGSDFLNKLGFEIEPFGGNDYALKAVPAILVGANYARLVRDVLDDLGHVGKTTRIDEARDAIFARMACHAVLRAGDDVNEAEARGLFRQMDSIDFGANCPHGRPVYYRLPVTELEEAFGRS
jgi:DNA mismatch repair protein MutL